MSNTANNPKIKPFLNRKQLDRLKKNAQKMPTPIAVFCFSILPCLIILAISFLLISYSQTIMRQNWRQFGKTLLNDTSEIIGLPPGKQNKNTAEFLQLKLNQANNSPPLRLQPAAVNPREPKKKLTSEKKIPALTGNPTLKIKPLPVELISKNKTKKSGKKNFKTKSETNWSNTEIEEYISKANIIIYKRSKIILLRSNASIVRIYRHIIASKIAATQLTSNYKIVKKEKSKQGHQIVIKPDGNQASTSSQSTIIIRGSDEKLSQSRQNFIVRISEMAELYRATKVGTPVVIVDK